LEEVGRQFLAAFRCEPVPEQAGDLYAAVKLARQKSGLSLDENDLWVAATALALCATLVSRDSDSDVLTACLPSPWSSFQVRLRQAYVRDGDYGANCSEIPAFLLP
jgi:predicted nucleic acid-binding protein